MKPLTKSVLTGISMTVLCAFAGALLAGWLGMLGGVAVCLHPQKYTFPDSLGVNCTGVNPEPLWLPSQKGCVALLPQAHHQ